MPKVVTIGELIDELIYIGKSGKLNKDAVCELWIWSAGSEWPIERPLSMSFFSVDKEANKLILRVKC